MYQLYRVVSYRFASSEFKGFLQLVTRDWRLTNWPKSSTSKLTWGRTGFDGGNIGKSSQAGFH